MNKTAIFGFLAILLIFCFAGCDNGSTNNNSIPVVDREQAGLGMTYNITNKQVYDDSNRSQAWNGNIANLYLGHNTSAGNIGSVTNGKMTVTLPSITPTGTDAGVDVLSNDNDVKFLMYWAFDNWAGGAQSADPRYRIRMREVKEGYTMRWVLIYADKEGLVKVKTNDGSNEIYDLDLVQGWNAACTSGSNDYLVTHRGFENFVPYYDGVGK